MLNSPLERDLIMYDNQAKRLNLNDLLQRAKEKEKEDRKRNVLIISAASALAATILIIVSL